MPIEATYAEAEAQLIRWIHLLEETDKFANANTDNALGLLNAIIDNRRSDVDIDGAMRVYRGGIGSVLSPASVRTILSPSLMEIVRSSAINKPWVSYAQAVRDWRDYLIAQTPDRTVRAREFTWGNISAGGSNVGNGTIRRLLVDENGYELEGAHAETKTFRCVRDQGQVFRHEEVFRVEGEPAEPDFLEVDGTGLFNTIQAAASARDQSIVRNPSFSQFTGTAPTAGAPTTLTSATQITGWTVTTAASCAVGIDVPDVYRDYHGDTTPKWVKFIGNNTITQILRNNARPVLDRYIPYHVQVAVYRETNADGTFTLRWGAASKAVDITTLTNDAWNIVQLDLDQNRYYKNFKEANLDIQMQWSGRTVGTIYMDDVIVRKMQVIDAVPYIVIGGATPFMVEDTFTFTDSVAATRGIIMYWVVHRSGLEECVVIPHADNPAQVLADP